MKSPLSQAQLGIYFACVTAAGEEPNYQNAELFPLPEDVDLERLQSAVLHTLCAHPYMCSRIVVNEEGVPVVQTDNIQYTKDIVPIRKVSEEEWTEVQNTFARTMDIHSERLFRTEIYQINNQQSPITNYLYLDIHHVLSDGYSLLAFSRDISAAYNGHTLTPETMDGAAIAQAEAALRADEARMNEAREWYAHEFCDAVETDSLPIPETQQSQIPNPEHICRSYPLSVTKEETQTIQKRFDAKEDTIMQVAWALLLAAYSAEEKASYCTPYHGRSDRRTLDALTMMVKTLPVFVNWSNQTSAMPLKELITGLDKQQQQARKLMYYSYPDVVQDLGLNNQVIFVYQGKAADARRNLQLGDEQAQLIDLRKPIPGWRICAELEEAQGQYLLRISYSTADYSEAFIQEMVKCYSAIIRSMVQAETVKDIDYCMPEQIEWLDRFKGETEECRKTAANPFKGQSLVGIFKKHVAEHPNAICVVAGEKRLTYAEVDKLSDTLDEQYTIPCGEHVIGYSVPRNEQMIIVPLSIAKAGMTAMPLDSSYPAERLEFMRGDATKYDGKGAFILLYTSGTTGTPKGVMLSEENILAFCEFHTQLVGMTPESRYATYAGYGFDAFMHDLWSCMYVGCAIYVIAEDIRFDLDGMHDYFEQEEITHTFMTTQVATQMAINYPNIKGLKVLGTGGEKLMSLNPPSYRLMNFYGPTETTVYVTHFEVKENEPNIPIGYPNSHVELFIVNKQGKRLPCGAAGELLIAGPQVGIGYLNQPEKTAEAFVEVQFGDAQTTKVRVYKTGDIVRYRRDGAIEFVGRRDGQVKIRGFRIELKEVEAVIRQFEGIKDATVQAFDYPDGGGKFIAAYVVSDNKIDIQALNTFILDQKPPYMVPAVTMQIDAIPLNQNQKVNKRALPEPKVQSDDVQSTKEAAPLNVLEEQIKEMIEAFVGNSDFGITTDLRYVGLSSISAIKLATQIYKRYGVQLDAKQMTKGITLQAIENEILKVMMDNGQKTKDRPSDSNTSSLREAPLSFSQLGVYFECMKNPTSTLYNVPICIQMPLEVETDALRHAVRKAVLNHSELFVHFATQETDVIQTIDESMMNEAAIDIPEKELSEAQMDAFKHEFVQPFNLSIDLLFRFVIVRTEKNLYLLSDIHHLVCDGASYDLFIHEICDLLEGKKIEPEMCSYPQFVAEQKAEEDGEAFKAAKDFFAERLAGVESITEIQPDLTNALPQGENGRVCVPFDMPAAEQYATRLGVTPAAVLLSAVYYSLARFAGTDDVCITTISNGRSNLQVNNTMGMFVNTLALTAKIGDQTVESFIRENAHSFEQTLSHEDYPFARVAADFDLKAEIMFAYQMGVLSTYSVFGQPVYADETMEQNVPKFKIAFYIMPVDGVPSIAVEYDNGWYSEALITNLAQSVANTVTAFAANTDVPLRAISLLNEAQTAVLDAFNQTEVSYDNTQTIVSLFRKQAAETPDNIAVVYHDTRLTYKEVDERTDAIAARIIDVVGCDKKEQVVSILINRSEWMVVASLAALKAGCAYQPLDPSYPAERLNFMMQDANAALLIADEDLRPIVNEYTGPVLLTKELSNSPKDGLGHTWERSISETVCQRSGLITPSDLFILLYTSGSTGVPKGCQLEHRNLVAFCHWYHRYYDLHAGDKVAAYASYGFDANMMDMYPALTCGATVYIIGEDIRLNLPDLNHYFDAEGITHSFMTTQVGYQFAQNCDNHSLRHLSVGGEKLATLAPPANYQLHNAYGPTECTIFTTTYPIHEQEKNIPIGKPLDNFRLFIVDKDLHRVPVGATGELLVSGPQVSRGYLNRPDKTAETYIDWNGLRCYRTGDVVRYLEDGNIQFVGRQDGQVKIRGFRIELKEVEAVIREFPAIKDATVQAFDYPNGGKFIAAYIVSDTKIDIQALNAFIRDRKPPYMVPASTMQIDVIPLNQNQKVNKRALPAPQLMDTDRDYVAPANDDERLFCDIFASILNQDKIGATDNFFELGGTSLMVTRVIIEADKAGKHVAYGDIFTHPTPRLLAQFLSGDETNTSANTNAEEAAFDYSGIDAILQRNNLEMFLRGERQELGNVLLTGATGYLGIHVLRELIDSDAKTITCLVRGKDQHDAERRLRNLLFYYFNRRFDELFGTRLFVVNGDVTGDIAKCLNDTINDHMVNDQMVNINTVFNCAANVKHFSKTDDIEQVNIGGAERCVEFCLATGARLVHISTTSVGEIWVERGDGKAVPELTERVLYFGQFLDNRYMRSKFLAERVILEAVARHGLNAKIMRVGNLAARSYDGEFQANFQSNSYMGRLKVFSILGCCPIDEYDSPAEFSPVDETAKAVVLLASTPKECTVFQPFNNHTDLLGDILAGFEKIGKSIRYVENDEFQQTILEASQDPKKASLMSALLAYQDMTHGQKAVTIERNNRFTSAVLLRLGFHWSTPDTEYVNRMLTAIAQLGFFDD